MSARAEVQDIATIVEANPVSVLIDDNLYARLRDHVEAEIKAFVPDLSTVTSRKEIGSLAYKVTRTKTAIDNAGKKLNEDARAQINKVDAKRRIVRDEFEALAERARKPLTVWEAQEDARIERCMTVLKAIEDCGNGLIGGEPQPFGILFHELEQKIIIDDTLGEFEEQARTAHRIATDKLKAAFQADQKAEADRAELAQLRADRDRRDREDAERRAAEAAAEHARQAQAEAEKREADRLATIDAAKEQARREEASRAKAEQETRDREAREAIDAANRRTQEAIDAANLERQAREAEEAASRAEQERREKDRAHRAEIMGAAKDAIIAQGAGIATANKIVLAIVAGEIPNVSMRF